MIISENSISNLLDKAISVGEKSKAIIKNNLLKNNNIIMAIRTSHKLTFLIIDMKELTKIFNVC